MCVVLHQRLCCFTPEGVLLYTNPWCVAVHNRQIAPRPRCSEDSSTAMNPRFGVQDSGSLITAARIGVSRSLLPGRVVCCFTPEVVSLYTRGCVALHIVRLCRFTPVQRGQESCAAPGEFVGKKSIKNFLVMKFTTQHDLYE